MSQPTSTIIPETGANGGQQSLTRRLDAGEELWVWKMGLRAALVIISIVGIGCVGWAVATRGAGPYGYDDSWGLVWSLLTFSISVIWCTTCILVLLFRRPNRPVHPGVAVGIDLVLWLAYIATAMFALLGLYENLYYGSYGSIDSYSSSGGYEQAANGTWVYVQSDYEARYGETRDCNSDFNNYGFHSCAEEDAYVNALWNARNKRVKVVTTGVVCQFVGLALHLALFIWACVDTHRRNKRKLSKDAEKLATDIVMNMIRNGAVVPGQNQNQDRAMQQPLLYHHQQPGRSPIAVPMMPPQPQPVVLGPEKGDSSRFA